MIRLADGRTIWLTPDRARSGACTNGHRFGYRTQLPATCPTVGCYGQVTATA